jgi:capsular exopolysaccharide synthesis family protein
VLAVTSPGTGEGKSLTALNLAISIAMEIGHTVLLVDANLRHPSVHTQLGLSGEPGLSDYLLDNLPLNELFVHPKGVDHLTLLPGGRPLQNSAEMLNSPKMSRLVDELKSRYAGRIVIFDLPPVLTAADAMAFAPYVDATLLVVEEGKSQRKEIEHALELLSSTNVLGTVLNKAGHH